MVHSIIYLSYTDIMRNSEFIRTNADPSHSAILSVPTESGAALLTFLHAGRSSWPGDDEGLTAVTERGHAHEIYHAVLYTAGRNTIIHNGQTHSCSRGTLILTDPGCIHEYRPQSPGGGSFIEITFDLREGSSVITRPWNEIMKYWLGAEVYSGFWPLNIPPPELELLESLMNDVVMILTGSTTYRESSAALAMGQFILELADYLNSGKSTSDQGTDRLDQARLTLEKNFTLPLSIAELASKACLSQGAFIRSFSARYGMPPIAYRKNLRITAAKHLLSVSGRSIGEIASNVGYRDIFAFSRTFKSLVGMTASDWRKLKNRN